MHEESSSKISLECCSSTVKSMRSRVEAVDDADKVVNKEKSLRKCTNQEPQSIFVRKQCTHVSSSNASEQRIAMSEQAREHASRKIFQL